MQKFSFKTFPPYEENFPLNFRFTLDVYSFFMFSFYLSLSIHVKLLFINLCLVLFYVRPSLCPSHDKSPPPTRHVFLCTMNIHTLHTEISLIASQKNPSLKIFTKKFIYVKWLEFIPHMSSTSSSHATIKTLSGEAAPGCSAHEDGCDGSTGIEKQIMSL